MASKSLLDAVVSLPLAAYHAFPFPNLPQVGVGLFNVFKLAFVEDPGWDLIHVRETINLASYLDHFVSKNDPLKCSYVMFLHLHLAFLVLFGT